MTSDWQIIVRINKDGQKMEMENMEFKDLPKALEQLIEGEQSEILKAQFRWMIAFFNEHYEAEK